jgi:hypothetical protein
VTDGSDQPTFEGPIVREPGFEPPLPAADVLRCPSCLSPIRADQRYCLECGERLGIDEIPPPPGGGSAMAERGAGLLAVAAVLLVLVGAGLSWVALREPAGDDGATSAAVTDTIVTEETITEDVFTEETITEEILTEETITEEVITDDAVDDWPPGEVGWAVVIYSKEVDRFSRDDAQALADEVAAAGVAGVGVLDSTNYPSLNPGYWVVYSGPFATKSDAETEVGEIRLLGYPEAYVREVVP